LLFFTFLLLYLLGNIFYSSGKTFAAEFPSYGEKLSSILSSIQEKLKISRYDFQIVNLEEQLNFNKIGSFLISSLGPFFSFLSNLFLVFIFLIFILIGRGRIKEKILESLPAKRSAKIIGVIDNIDHQIQKYLAIKTIVSLITGILATIVFLAFGLDFAILFGFLIFILNYIPTIGSILSSALPIFIAVFQYETIWPAFWIFLFVTIIQQTMGSFIEPRLLGGGLNLSPLVILFALFFWGWLWGIPGMILAVPMVVIIKIICSNIPSLEFVAALMSR
jgi:predicted PurR-regulated permease PerM